MKTKKNKLILHALILLLCTGLSFNTVAQQKLIYYWNFNNLNTGLSAAVSPSSIGTIHANWGSLDSTKATISYVPALTVSSKYKTYWDNAAGEASDTFNIRFGAAKGTATGNNELRVRSPSDSMEVLFTLPTTKYKNLTLKFGTERTSSGPSKENYDYSTDGGTTWTTKGMSQPNDTILNSVWNLVAISFAGDIAVNNNSNFIFRIKIGPPNSTTTGNIRLDNISLEGDSIGAPAQKLIHYWHFNNFTGLSAAGSPLLITPIHANWSALDSTKALIAYVPAYTVSSKYATYWDANAGDTVNARLAEKNQASGTNNALRVRNPSDSMQLLFYIPTTHYQNINVKYELEYSSITTPGSPASAPGYDLFDYSVDSGKTFVQNGLSIYKDTMTNGNWNLVSINFGADPAVNNSNKFIFRIRTTKPNSNTKGNHRYDNFTVEGDSIIPAVSVAKINSNYLQNFDSLSNATASSSLPYGWYLYETGTNANSTYAADSGTLTAGNTYSYGHKGNSNRALGSLASGSLLPNYGVAIRNNTGSVLKTLTIGFTVEQWRLGSGTRGNPDSMYASMSTNANGLGSGTWTKAPSLTFTSPVYTGTAGQLDGNNTANQKKVNATLTGLSIPAGGLLWLKWTDPNILSSDDGLAIDNFTISTALAPIYKIREVRPQDPITGVADSLNKGIGYIKGVVISPSFSSTSLQFSLADSTGSITVFTSKIKYYTPAIGDSIMVHGTLTQFSGVTEYTADSIMKLTKGIALPRPSITSQMNETYESGLITIKGVHIIDTTTWKPAGSGFNVNVVDNNKDTFVMRIAAPVDLFKKGPIHGIFNVTGVETQFKSSSPFIGGYEIEPRGITDIVPVNFAPLYKIRQIRGQDLLTGVADSISKGKGFIKGVVMSPSYGTSYLQFSLADSTGAITIFTSSVKNYTPVVGDSIIARGFVTQFDGVTEYTADSIITINKGTWLETAPVLKAMDEAHESHLIKINNVHIINPIAWTGLGSGFNVNITDGKDTFIMRITSAVDLFKQSAITGNFNVTGIESQFVTVSPLLGSYEIEPRSSNDIQLIPAIPILPLYKIREVRVQDATTGVADSINKANGYIKGVVMSPTFSTSYLQFSLVDSTGAITIFTSSIKYYSPSVGDSIIAHGVVTQFDGVTEYTTDTIIVLSKGSSLETASVLTAMDETHESHLIKINNVHIINPTAWTGTGSGFNVNITDGKDTFIMRITNNVDLYKQAAIKGNFNVTGIESQFVTVSPLLGGYEIEPRSSADIELIPSNLILPLYTISQVRPQDASTGVADSLNKAKGYIKGVVMSPSYSTSYLQFSLVDNTGAITIFTSTVKYYTPAVGDSILAHGVVTQFDGVTEYTTDSIIVLSKGTTLETPTILTKFDEAHESHLIKVKNVHIIDPTQWTGTGTGFNVNITDGKDTFAMRITSAVDLYKQSAIKGNFNLTGIETQFITTSPLIGGYEIEPRGAFDVEPIAAPVLLPLYKISQVRPQDADGVADSVNKAKGYIKGVVVSPSYSTSYLQFSLVDNTGAVTIFTSSVKYYTPAIGDSIMAHGFVTQFNGVTEYTTDSIIVLPKGTAIETPSALTVLDETHESHLIKINKVHLVDPTQWTGAGTGFNVSITNGPDTFSMRITSAIDLFKKAPIKGLFNVTGVETQFKSASPYFGGYQIEPRGIIDIQLIPLKLYTIAQVKPYNTTTGIADSLGLACLLHGVVQSPGLTGSPIVQDFSVQDNTGGISVVSTPKLDGYTPNIGDSVFLRGLVSQSNGLTVFLIDSISKKSGGSAISPVVVTTLDESTESKLVTLQTYALTTPSQWDTTKAVNGLMTVQAAQFGTSNTITMVIARGTNLYLNSAAPTGHFDVTGISSQNDPAAPFLADYILLPRSISDFEHSSGIENADMDNMHISVYPNPASDFVNISATFPISKITVIDMIGNTVATVIPGSGLAKINTGNFSKGLYILKVENGTNSYIARLVKE